MPKVDKDKCIGCGLCASVCSDCFELDSDGKSQVKATCDASAPCVEEAVSGCPVSAISK